MPFGRSGRKPEPVSKPVGRHEHMRVGTAQRTAPRSGCRGDVRPTPFACHDVYMVTEKILAADGAVTEATGEYRHTIGPRSQIELYRERAAAFGPGRVFAMKRPR